MKGLVFIGKFFLDFFLSSFCWRKFLSRYTPKNLAAPARPFLFWGGGETWLRFTNQHETEAVQFLHKTPSLGDGILCTDWCGIGESKPTVSVHLLTILSFQSNLAQKLFDSPHNKLPACYLSHTNKKGASRRPFLYSCGIGESNS